MTAIPGFPAWWEIMMCGMELKLYWNMITVLKKRSELSWNRQLMTQQILGDYSRPNFIQPSGVQRK